MENLKNQDPDIFDTIVREEKRQNEGIELIASENYVSKAVLEAMGSVLTNKYSEGYVGKRYYAGNEIIDEVEQICMDRAKALFSCEHVNIQPLSGSPANLAVYFATLKPGDKVLGLALDHGGHLSHGHPVNASGILYDFSQYKLDKDTGLLDMDHVREIALKEKPKMLIAGFSAYSRNMDWKAFKDIADEVGAITFADIAHIAGLIAGGVIESPVPYFDIVSTTTHKTLRGPRGAIVMCKEKYKKAIDRAVFPGMQGGPHDHINAAKAVAFKEALQPSFKTYAKNVIDNASKLSDELIARGFKIVSDGTDNHLMVVDMTSKGISGGEAEKALDKIGLSCSRSTIPFDTRKPFDPSGIRIGTAALTTRGMVTSDMAKVADWITKASDSVNDEAALKVMANEVKDFSLQFPLFKA